MRYPFRVLLLACLGLATTAGAAPQWQTWSDALFERALQEKRFVLLDLEAVWCHWCHVMDHETYASPTVQQLIERHYIAVKVDQDARPDLSRRYEDYGWPATIVFAPDGTEIVKRRGFIPPERFAQLLQAFATMRSIRPGRTLRTRWRWLAPFSACTRSPAAASGWLTRRMPHGSFAPGSHSAMPGS